MKKGRPTKFKEPIKNKIIDAIGVGSTYTMACNYAGISRNTLHQWMVKGENQTRGVYRTFYDDIKKAEAKGAVANLAVINNEAKRGNWKCSAWLLERRWGYKRDSQFNNLLKPNGFLILEFGGNEQKASIKKIFNKANLKTDFFMDLQNDWRVVEVKK